MRDSDLLKVVTVSLHAWRTCPCQVCEEKREQEDSPKPADFPIRKVSVETAYCLGLIPSRCSEGSLARRLSVVLK